MNSKWIKQLNKRSEGIELLVENIGSICFDISLSHISLAMSLKKEEQKQK